MMARRIILAGAFAVLIGSTVYAMAQEKKDAPSPSGTSGVAASTREQQEVAVASGTIPAPAPGAHSAKASRDAAHTGVFDARAMRIEGEKRFRTNCGRCHMAPQKLPPRAMATVIRHMRVRAMITDEDMRLILQYMTQ